MNKQAVSRIVIVFVALELAGLTLAFVGLDPRMASAQSTLVALGAALFAGGLAFALVALAARGPSSDRLSRSGTIFGALTIAGVCMAVLSARVPDASAQTILVHFGAAILAGGLAFLLITALGAKPAHPA